MIKTWDGLVVRSWIFASFCFNEELVKNLNMVS